MKAEEDPKKAQENKNEDLPGYPIYPASEDIYRQQRKEEDLDPEDPAKLKTTEKAGAKKNEKDFEEDVSGADLDVPGAELDDAAEETGSEDEENNHYSLGND